MKYEVGVVHKQVACDTLSCKKRIEPHQDWGHSVFLYSDCSSLLSPHLTTLDLAVCSLAEVCD